MNKYIRRGGIILLSPVICFIIICILIYIPPIQNFLVDKATRYASEATGMQIHIGRISLSFPLDLAIHETQIIHEQDTILDVERLTVKVQMFPLFKKQVELDGLELKRASVNTAGLMDGMRLKGELGDFFIESHGVNLKPETAVINNIRLKDTHLSLCLADTTAADTTQSAPVYWKFILGKLALDNVSFSLQMPLDTIDTRLEIGMADIENGLIDLHRSAYTFSKFRLQNGKARYDSGHPTSGSPDFNPAHISITDMNIGIDSIYYEGNNIRADIREFVLKERSGLEILSTEGKLAADEQTIRIPDLRLKTTDSYLNIGAGIDWSTTKLDTNGSVYLRLNAEIGKKDLLKFLSGLPEETTKSYPSVPLQLQAGIDGNLNDLQLTAFNVSFPGIFKINANGKLTHCLDSIKRSGNLALSAQFKDMKFIQRLTGGVVIPPDMTLEGTAGLKGDSISTMLTLKESGGEVSLSGGYNLAKKSYRANIGINALDLSHFMPNDSLHTLSAMLDIQGCGTDFFSPHTRLSAECALPHLLYGSKHFSGIGLKADLQNSTATVSLEAADSCMDISTRINALLHPERIKADMGIHIHRLDLQALGLSPTPFNTSQDIDIRMSTDMKQNHDAQATIKNVHLTIGDKSFSTKDLHLGLSAAPDSIKSYVNAGDLTFLFRTEEGIDRFTKSVNRLAGKFEEQWERKHIDFNEVQQLMPFTNLRIFSGNENPIANFLSAKRINYNRFFVNLETSPETGLNGDAYLYGLHTDSIALDTIYFHSSQYPEKIRFSCGIKADNKPFQEAFDVSLKGSMGADEINLVSEYLNGKKEQGVYLGLTGKLHKEGISLHIRPDETTLVYRTFKANPDNYIYFKNNGRIHANLSLYDESHTGLSFYSTPDSTAQQDLTLSLNQIDIAEFRRIIPYMPDIAGIINAEAHYVQVEEDMQVSADLGIDGLAYDKQPLGNWALNTVYLPKGNNEHRINAFMTLNDKEIATVNGSFFSPENSKQESSLAADITLSHFPLPLANSFIPGQAAVLGGDIDGSINVKGELQNPLVNGEVSLDSVTVGIPQASLTLRMDNRPVKIADSRMLFDRFSIFTKGKTPFTIDGYADFSDMANINLDLKTDAANFEVLNTKRNKESLVYGKLYIDFHSSLKGSLDALTIRGNTNILGGSDFTYILKDSPLTVEDRLSETVTFVDFNDTARTNKPNMQAMTLGGIDMLMTLHIDEAVQCRVELNESGSNYMSVEGGGDLSFQYTPEGNMVLNGRYSLISGEIKYEMPVIPLKTFHIQNGSYIEWTGNIMDPKLNIKASERMRASVAQEGKSSRVVNFDVGVDITNRLENLGFTFTLEAPDDGTVQNELAGMSAEERNKLAVTMLVTGMYMAEGNSGSGKGFDANSALNSFLQSEINNIAGSALKTIDVNFGMETTDQGEDGSTRTDYNFQFAKRFWNNRFRIVIGGKISTGNTAAQEESFIDNVSIEYRLDSSGTRYIKVFHDKNYESILDGEVIETGAGIVLRRKISRLGELFIFKNRKKKPVETETNL